MSPVPTFSILLRIAWRQYLLRFDVILLTNILVAVPLYALLELATPYDLLNSIAGQGGLTLESAWNLLQQPAYQRYIIIQTVVGWLTTWISLSIFVAMHQTYLQKPSTPMAVFRISLGYIARATRAAVLISVLVALGYALFILPGIVLSVVLTLVVPSIVWHNDTVLQAIKRSWKLARAQFFQVFAYIIFVEMLVSLVSLAVIFSLPTLPSFTTIGLVIGSIISGYTTIFIAVLYTALLSNEFVKIHSED